MRYRSPSWPTPYWLSSFPADGGYNSLEGKLFHEQIQVAVHPRRDINQPQFPFLSNIEQTYSDPSNYRLLTHFSQYLHLKKSGVA
jgi:hypothetical protein